MCFGKTALKGLLPVSGMGFRVPGILKYSVTRTGGSVIASRLWGLQEVEGQPQAPSVPKGAFGTSFSPHSAFISVRTGVLS